MTGPTFAPVDADTGDLLAAVERYVSRCEWDGDCLVANVTRYGGIKYGSVRLTAHRAVHIVFNGPVAKGQHVRHRCDRKQCVNPNHLEVGSPAQNGRDKRRLGLNLKRHDMRGGSNWTARLTEAQVVELRRRARSGEQIKVLSTELGVSYTAAWYAVRGHTWVDVAEPPVPSGYRWSKPSPMRRPASDRITALQMINQGATLAEVASVLGCSRKWAFRLTQEEEVA